MKKVLILTLILLGCVVLALWSPWLYWNFDPRTLFGVVKPNSVSGLQVYSLSGEMQVLIDGQESGTVTPEKSPLIVDGIKPGEKLITLKRVSQEKGVYKDFSKLINFVEGINVVISYNLGPEAEFSEGHIISAVLKTNSADESKLKIKLNTDSVNFQLDENVPTKINSQEFSTGITTNQHKIKLTKLGFEPLEFTILPEDKDERSRFQNYDIVLEAYLMLQPVELTTK